jgi:hypothetical protein
MRKNRSEGFRPARLAREATIDSRVRRFFAVREIWEDLPLRELMLLIVDGRRDAHQRVHYKTV